MLKIKAWFSALRLRTLTLSLSGILLGSGAAHYNNHWDNKIFFLAILTSILFQIISNLANDLGDGIKGTDNNNRIGPIRGIQSGIISKKEMKTGIILTTILSILSSLLLIYHSLNGMPYYIIIFFIILAILCIVAAISYTLGSSPYGYYGFGDIMVYIFFGFISVIGVYTLFAKSFLSINILLAIFIGSISTAVINLNNMRDFENDKKCNKNTLVVKIGIKKAKNYHIILILSAFISIVLYLNKLQEPMAFLALIPSVFLFKHLWKIIYTTNPKEFDSELKIVSLTGFFLSINTLITLIVL